MFSVEYFVESLFQQLVSGLVGEECIVPYTKAVLESEQDFYNKIVKIIIQSDDVKIWMQINFRHEIEFETFVSQVRKGLIDKLKANNRWPED